MNPLVPTLLIAGSCIGLYKILQTARVGKRESYRHLKLFGRPLGLLERWYAAYTPPRMFTEAIVVRGPSPDMAHLQEIIKVLCCRFPILNASLDFSSQNLPVFADLNMPHGHEFPVRIEKAAKDTWENEITKQINIPFTSRVPSTPLWRLVVLHDPNSPLFSIVLSFHHVIGDALSTAILLKNFVQIHNDLVAGNTPDKEEIPTLVLEDVMDIRPTYTNLLSKIFFNKKESRKDYLGPPEKNAQLSTNAYFMKLREDVLVPLRAACKKESVTLHGALSAAILFATSSLQTKEEVELSFHFPVSLRKYVSQSDNPNFMGLCTSGADMKGIKMNKNSSFWELGNRINKETEPLAQAAVSMIGMLKFLPIPIDQFINVKKNQGLPNNRDSSAGFSNLGQIDFSNYENEERNSWSVQELYFAAPNHVSGPLIHSTCATVGNTMNFMTMIPDPVLPYEAGKTFQKRFLECIVAATSNSQFKLSDLS